MSDSNPSKPTAASSMLNPIPEGFYTVRLGTVLTKKPTSAGTWMMLVSFEIAEGPYEGQPLTALAFSKVFLRKATRALGVRDLTRAMSYPPE